MIEQKSAGYSYPRCVFIAAVFQSPKRFQRQKVSAADRQATSPGNVARQRRSNQAMSLKHVGLHVNCFWIGAHKKKLDMQYHIQEAAKAYHANKFILEDRKVAISQHLRYFNSVVSSAACIAGGHYTIYQEHLRRA